MPQPATTSNLSISVCVATYRRAERLAKLLDDLQQQSCLPAQVVVVDNDATGSAAEVVDKCRRRAPPFKLLYAIQPARNIALTRNKTVEMADGDWIAFIDDDERAPKEWLGQLLAAADKFGADGIFGPVEPVVPDSAPAWIRRGRFYDFPHLASGQVVPLHRMRFGNVILRGEQLRVSRGPLTQLTGSRPAKMRISSFAWKRKALASSGAMKQLWSNRWKPRDYHCIGCCRERSVAGKNSRARR